MDCVSYICIHIFMSQWLRAWLHAILKILAFTWGRIILFLMEDEGKHAISYEIRLSFKWQVPKGKFLSRTRSTEHSHWGHSGLAWFLGYYNKMRLELVPNFLACSLILLRIAITWIFQKMSLNSILHFIILTPLTTFLVWILLAHWK